MPLRDQYLNLYEKLKGPGLESILEKHLLDEYEREAIRIIARLPEPLAASNAEIASVCHLCIRYKLELLFNVASIGETARQIEAALKEVSDEPPRPFASEDLTVTIYRHSLALDRLAYEVNAMSRKFDLNLKGRCIYCHGDLAEVIVDPGGGKPKQLRLQCRQQRDARCKTFDWYLQDVDERKR